MSGEQRPEIVVVVPTYQRPSLLGRMVRALEAQTLPRHRFEVVIVDDGSTDDTERVLAGLVAGSDLALRPLHLRPNRGPASARNAAWRSSAAPYVAFTDDDCVPEPGWLEAGLAALQADPSIGVVQGCTLRPAGAEDLPTTDWTVYREIQAPTPWFEGCNLFFRREALEAAGGYDEDIAWFGEETALGWSVLDAGWRRSFADGAVVRHDYDERGVRWHMRHRYLEKNIVALAARFPELRHAFWRPWAMHRVNATFALAVAGIVLGLWKPPAAFLTIPYLRHRLPALRHPRWLQLFGEHIATDGAAFLGHVEASARHRLLVL